MRPVTFALPFAAALVVMFGPETETDDAFELLHVIVVEPGAVVLVGLALIEAETDGGADVTSAVAELEPM